MSPRRSALRGLFAVVTTLALLLGPARAGRAAPAPVEMRVFAAASLSSAFGDLAHAFESAHPGVRVRLVLAGSQTLVAQLSQGAVGDVFASADERWMSEARTRHLLAGEPAVFARNRLAVIVPATNPARLAAVHDLAKPGLKLVLAADAVPVGHYAREMLRHVGAGMPAGWTGRVLANVVSEEETVKAVVTKVQLGEADAGVAYRSDVSPALARYVRVLPLADSLNVIATYPIAPLAGSAHPELARAFVELVRSEAGQRVLERNGLIRVEAAR